MASAQEILSLVEAALREFDRCPLEDSMRHAIRIANLLDDKETAIRLSLDLIPSTGERTIAPHEVRKALPDPGEWAAMEGPYERALALWTKDRSLEDGQVMVQSLDQLHFWDNEFAIERSIGRGTTSGFYDSDTAAREVSMNVRSLARFRTFTALTHWERRLAHSGRNSELFRTFQSFVDQALMNSVPEALSTFNAAFRVLSESAARHPDREVGEDFAVAVTSCRGIIKAVANRLFPPEGGDFHTLDDSHYRNRVRQFTKERGIDKKTRKSLNAQVAELFQRFNTLDDLPSAGVLAKAALSEAELCALQTYVVSSELVRLGVTTDRSAKDTTLR